VRAVLFRLESNPACNQFLLIGGLNESETPPDWIEVLAIQPDRLIAYKEPHLKGITAIKCHYLCNSDQGFFVIDSMSILDAIDDEYLLVPHGSAPRKRARAKRPRKTGGR
jgi:hypothetical protein